MASAAVVNLERPMHVGDLNAADKKDWSYEGQGLSISQDPDAWRQIARLGDAPTWRGAPLLLLDAHALTDDERSSIREYAASLGWLTPVDLYRVTYFDSDYEEERFFTEHTREAAEYEAEEYEDASIASVPGFTYTDQFPDSTARAGDIADDDVIVAAWVESQRPDLDGVWWNDTLDVYALSAPRGVVVPRAIAPWLETVQQV